MKITRAAFFKNEGHRPIFFFANARIARLAILLQGHVFRAHTVLVMRPAYITSDFLARLLT